MKRRETGAGAQLSWGAAGGTGILQCGKGEAQGTPYYSPKEVVAWWGRSLLPVTVIGWEAVTCSCTREGPAGY